MESASPAAPLPTPTDCAAEAEALFKAGYSCAQAVLGACAPNFGIPRETALRWGAGLGAGLGGLRETCGAVTAMAAITGLRLGSTEPMDAKTKAALYRQVQAAVADFDSAFGTHNCLALLRQASIEKQAGTLPEARSEAYYAKRPCAAFVRFCAARAMQ